MTRFLLEVIPRARLREGRSWICTVCGTQARTHPGLALANGIDPTFSAERVFFSCASLLAALEEGVPGQVYYLEDRTPGIRNYRGVLAAVLRQKVGLIVEIPTDDHHHPALIRANRDTALFCDARDPEGRRVRWYEVARGAGRRRLVHPEVGGETVSGITIPDPPEALLAAYREMIQDLEEVSWIERYPKCLGVPGSSETPAAPMPGGLRLIDRGAFARFVEKEHLLLRTDGLQPPKEYLDGFVYGALAYRLYLRETADRQRMGRE
ncbi:MAG: hypothetical protein WC948_05915 [Thermovirgaceae bacterium]